MGTQQLLDSRVTTLLYMDMVSFLAVGRVHLLLDPSSASRAQYLMGGASVPSHGRRCQHNHNHSRLCGGSDSLRRLNMLLVNLAYKAMDL